MFNFAQNFWFDAFLNFKETHQLKGNLVIYIFQN